MKRVLTRSAVAFFVAVSALGVAAVPASAHTLASAVVSADGCGWPNGNYTILHSDPVEVNGVDIPYERLGTAYLLWNAQYGQNCAVALRTGSAHGVASQTKAVLRVGSDKGFQSYTDAGSYGHFAAVSASAENQCVNYTVWIDSPETGRTGQAGRAAWGNCS
ncbi:hypothetical protein FAF44_33090 [Nonomuraea sp. MG754425]|uniref:hypothetical protein n=1 Tax=Nonomuraea sp. MG754425 TaxID=2570319 RepID=UPI001F366DC7|nr:hypothetical protein [Nonomuraea sp. MG754425]MCF6473189.1 hypothetical protein [Nonomuraea sp. MG754425]